MNKKYSLIECSSVREFWDKLSPEKPLKSNTSKFIYRGHGNAVWPLMPAILRDNIRRFWQKEQISYDEQIFFEIAVLNYFVEQCDLQGLRIPNDSSKFRIQNLDINQSGNDKYYINPSDWPNDNLLELMALAQHHGVPTRLLDWTKRSYVAAYFAASSALASCEGSISKNKIAIWALDIECINLYRNIMLVKVPGATSSNLAAQSGLFTFLKQFGKRGEIFKPIPLEDEFLSLPGTPLWKITLPVEHAIEVLDLCELYGISASTLFPGYDGSARAVSDWINNYTFKTLRINSRRLK